VCNRGCPRKPLTRSAALWGDREKTGKQTKKERRRRECLILGAFIIFYSGGKREWKGGGKRGRRDVGMRIRGSVVYDYRRCYIFFRRRELKERER